MNVKLLETTEGLVLVFRDLDEDQHDIVIIQAWLGDDVISKTIIRVATTKVAKAYVNAYSVALAEPYLRNLKTAFQTHE